MVNTKFKNFEDDDILLIFKDKIYYHKKDRAGRILIFSKDDKTRATYKKVKMEDFFSILKDYIKLNS